MSEEKLEQVRQDIKSSEEKILSLENLIKDATIVSYDPDCIRKKSNWSKPANDFKFDHEDFSPEHMKKSLDIYSPKLQTLLEKIKELDEKDKKKHGKLFKHFIFSDLKFGNYGAKMIASAFIANGYKLGYKADLKQKKQSNKKTTVKNRAKKTNTSKKNYEQIQLHSNTILENTPNENFYMLSSVGVYDQNITVKMKKEMLQRFNQRPDNIHGDLIRFIILDSGFKEGIDLFDIKYVHIFEPSTYLADQKQVIGRGTRTCGQKGLEFHQANGWPLHVFIYDLSIPEKIQKSLMNSKTAMELYLKSMNMDIRLLNFTHDLEKATVLGSVDYDLNKNVHSFSIPFISEKEDKENHEVKINEHLDKNIEVIYGGKNDSNLTGIIDDNLHRIIFNEDNSSKRLNHDDMKVFIKNNFHEFAWDAVKMENLCIDKSKGGAGEIINYTPTQNFIRHYFHPMNPVKGMLLYHSVGTGKTCSAIAAATTNFEKNGYTILWVTRTSLKNDIWKNMFNQVCNESIRQQIENQNLKVPEEQKKQMRLLSKAWRIRPMSYKQFSNLILKKNALYENLVKINGKEDPLRRTLLIIDEAHKLYGGDDLSSIEKPDMDALQKALFYSYQYSGQDSVRLLLMTATPITKDPMELIKLVNLCKRSDEQMPSDFSNFSREYLNEEGDFTPKGRMNYLDDISGYVSYLNREKDARQFSQPQIEHINTPIISNVKDVEKFDKKIMRDVLEFNTDDLTKEMEEKTIKLNSDYAQLNNAKFSFLKEELCEDLTKKRKTVCNKIATKHIKEIIKNAKLSATEIKKNIKKLKELMKERKTKFLSELKNIKLNAKGDPNAYEKYKSTVLYELKSKCSRSMKKGDSIGEHIKNNPIIQKYDEEIEGYNNQIKEIEDNIKHLSDNYKIRMKQLKELLKTDLTDIERNVIKMVINDERDDYKRQTVSIKRENRKYISNIAKDIKRLEKNKTKKKRDFIKETKKAIKDEKKQTLKLKRDENKIRKTIKNIEIKDENLKDIINKQVPMMEKDIDVELEKIEKAEKEKELLKQKEKEKKLAEKEKQKKEKLLAKEKEKKAKEEQKKRDKEEKEAKKKKEREEKNATKKKLKEKEKLQKAQARKTKKKIVIKD